jgi:hypothetical protein
MVCTIRYAAVEQEGRRQGSRPAGSGGTWASPVATTCQADRLKAEQVREISSRPPAPSSWPPGARRPPSRLSPRRLASRRDDLQILRREAGLVRGHRSQSPSPAFLGPSTRKPAPTTSAPPNPDPYGVMRGWGRLTAESHLSWPNPPARPRRLSHGPRHRRPSQKWTMPDWSE